MNFKRWILLVSTCLLSSMMLAACDTDCIYKFYNTDDGTQLCGHFCPLDDDEGNPVLDSGGNPVFGKPEKVDRINCELPSSTSTTSTSSSSSSSSSSTGLI